MYEQDVWLRNLHFSTHLEELKDLTARVSP